MSGISVVISTTGGPYGVLGVHTRQHRTFTRTRSTFCGPSPTSSVRPLNGTRPRRSCGGSIVPTALSRCNEALIRATDESTLLAADLRPGDRRSRVSALLGRLRRARRGKVGTASSAGRLRSRNLDTLRLTWADTERGRGPTGTCIRTRQPVLSKHIATDPDAPWRRGAETRLCVECRHPPERRRGGVRRH